MCTVDLMATEIKQLHISYSERNLLLGLRGAIVDNGGSAAGTEHGFGHIDFLSDHLYQMR